MSNSSFSIAIQVLFGIILLLFWVIGYLIRSYGVKERNSLFKQFVNCWIAPAFLVFLTLKILVFANAFEDYDVQRDEIQMNSVLAPSDFCVMDSMYYGRSVFDWGRSDDEAEIALLDKHLIKSGKLHLTYQKLILSTAVGFKSAAAAIEPWEVDSFYKEYFS